MTSTLIHEIVHATIGLKNGHNKVFKQCALAVGLQGKMTATTSSDKLKETMKLWFKSVGDYPHATLENMTNNQKKQTTRLIKCECSSCGYNVRITRKWLEVATPKCPVCDIDMTYDNGEEGV